MHPPGDHRDVNGVEPARSPSSCRAGRGAVRARPDSPFSSWPASGPAIHVFGTYYGDVGARDKPAHDGLTRPHRGPSRLASLALVSESAVSTAKIGFVRKLKSGATCSGAVSP